MDFWQVFPVPIRKLCSLTIFLLVFFPSFLWFRCLFLSLLHFLPCKTLHPGLLPNVHHFHIRSPKKCTFTDHELREYCLSLLLLFFHTLCITLPLKIPVSFTENQTDVSVGENGEERGLWRGKKMWVVVREVKIC